MWLKMCVLLSTALTVEYDLTFVKIDIHEHARQQGQDDTLLVPQRPNSSALFTGREDILERLKDHFAPQGEGDRCRKSFLLYGMGGIGKTQICLKFVEEMAGR
jgi:Holliday junction resolvasome RuvABC ATP-dependent DNA helicase subunit